jgi:heme oxygenase (mycobilin-producing)
MTVVKINAITVPGGAGPELEKRFAARAGAVDQQPGFEGFELLRPTDDSGRYFVVTRWKDDASFRAWLSSQSFGEGHGKPEEGRRPVSTGAELLSFEVVDLT